MSDKINNTQLLKDSGLRIVHVHPSLGGRSVTVAFREPRDRGHNIEISTAITNPNDTFTKKIGTKLAIENFLAGHTILIPDDDHLGAVGAVRVFFGAY